MAICLDPPSVARHNGRIANEPLGMRIRRTNAFVGKRFDLQSGVFVTISYRFSISLPFLVRCEWTVPAFPVSGFPFTRHRVISAGSKISSRLPN